MDGSSPPWKGDIRNCKWMVEPHFAEFGSPDLIAVFDSNKIRYAVFIEAKLLSYNDSCLSLPQDMDFYTISGHSSKINVQLSFRYRFSEALKVALEPGSMNKSIIETSHEYLDEKMRKLNKHQVLRFIADFFENVQEYYFVALTNDRSDELLPEIIKEENLPTLVDKSGKKVYDTSLLGRFGLLTYDELVNKHIVNMKDGFFGPAISMTGVNLFDQPADKLTTSIRLEADKAFKDAVDNQEESQKEAQGIELNITGRKFQEWNDRERWADSFASNEQLQLVKLDGSYSKSLLDAQGKKTVVMKLMIHPDYPDQLLLGLYDNKRIQHDQVENLKPFWGTVNKKRFYFFPFTENQSIKMQQLAIAYMESWLDDKG